MKKNTSIDGFKMWVNEQLERSHIEATCDFKRGLCEALENILHRENRYSGFMYLDVNADHTFKPKTIKHEDGHYEVYYVYGKNYFDRKYF